MGGGRRVWGPGAALPLLLAVLAAGPARPGEALQNVTAQLFGAEAHGTLAAFGDFNSDKQTDLFVLRGGERRGAGGGRGAGAGAGRGGGRPLPRPLGGEERPVCGWQRSGALCRRGVHLHIWLCGLR